MQHLPVCGYLLALSLVTLQHKPNKINLLLSHFRQQKIILTTLRHCRHIQLMLFCNENRRNDLHFFSLEVNLKQCLYSDGVIILAGIIFRSKCLYSYSGIRSIKYTLRGCPIPSPTFTRKLLQCTI